MCIKFKQKSIKLNGKGTRAVGRFGEELAVNFLKKLKYKILDRNFTTKIGEIDIIAEDKHGCVVFIEVKTQSNNIFSNPSQKVNAHKMQKYRMVATQYLAEKKLMHKTSRFDVIEIVGTEEFEINHLIDAFR